MSQHEGQQSQPVCLFVCLENKGEEETKEMDAEKPGPSGTSLTSRCTVGTKLDQECHKTYYTRKVGLKQVAALEKKSQELISWRSGITLKLLIFIVSVYL